MIYLKSIHYSSFKDIKHAVLVEPDLEKLVSSDAQLYAEIRKRKTVTILPFDAPMKPARETVEISSEEFCETWRGD
jgi:hypothetical protein